ncbi:DoxX family membrane protein [Lactococcus allomyrinae]|uniref:DoxX family protein n=1 Tax=Lactococcus allomyrinae TaxID=2419773 RepID=A0A387BET5_9LACT|nr:DoxX family protein [Lactococcus allomyrinae]AYG00764.1 DoxX family protein [Lactococcus allomyrinae]
MIKLLRTNIVASWVLTILRIYIGWQWVEAGWEKIHTSGGFHAEGLIAGALNQGTSEKPFAYPWFHDFLAATTNNGHNAGIFNVLVPWGELLVGLGLIFGTLTLAAAFFGLLMNFTYLLSGVVSTNPTFVVIQFLILIAGFNAAKIGLDYWITPFLRKYLPFLNNDINTRRVN